VSTLTVLDPGPLTTVQDAGRLGWAHLGVPRAGALDRGSAELANRLVGNPADAAVLETTVGGVRVRVDRPGWVAVTGADGPLRVGDRPAGRHEPAWVPAGGEVLVGAATSGVRAYVAFGGGIAVKPVLGSRSTDTLAWVGPAALRAGAVLPLGVPSGPPGVLEAPAVVRTGATLRVWRGPRADWLAPGEWERLQAARWLVAADSNRVGLRLRGPALRRSAGELPSEGIVLGAVQLPPDGQPVVFLADHPVTGGYPVVAVVHPDDLGAAAQARPGTALRFTRAR